MIRVGKIRRVGEKKAGDLMREQGSVGLKGYPSVEGGGKVSGI